MVEVAGRVAIASSERKMGRRRSVVFAQSADDQRDVLRETGSIGLLQGCRSHRHLADKEQNRNPVTEGEGHCHIERTAFLPGTQPSRTAPDREKAITERLIKTAVTTPGVHERNIKDAGMWGIKTFANMATMYPNIG